MLEFSKRRKRLLIVDDDSEEQVRLREFLGHDDLDLMSAVSGQEALDVLREMPVDCMVLALERSRSSALVVLEELRSKEGAGNPAVVLFTRQELPAGECLQLPRTMPLRVVRSHERLLNETAQLLHRKVENLSQSQQEMIRSLHGSDQDLSERTVLIVDDDVRNIFVLSSVLEQLGMRALTATNGQEALNRLAAAPVDVILMDIMMPDMDGFETIRAVRANPTLACLPIVALTARAMKIDRERCLEAGASDYLAKPVETAQLLATLRTWLPCVPS